MWTKLLLLAVLTLAGCGLDYYVPRTADKEGELVRSAYTEGGCIEALQEAAAQGGVEAEWASTAANYPGEVFLFPFLRGVTCRARVLREAHPGRLTGAVPKGTGTQPEPAPPAISTPAGR